METWRKHTQCSLDRTETKLLVFSSKPRVTRGSLNPQGDKLESTREKFEKKLCNFVDNNLKIELPLEATMHLNDKKKT